MNPGPWGQGGDGEEASHAGRRAVPLTESPPEPGFTHHHPHTTSWNSDAFLSPAESQQVTKAHAQRAMGTSDGPGSLRGSLRGRNVFLSPT